MTASVEAGVRASDPVRVTVLLGSRRLDFALAGAVPLAEILPTLTGVVGLQQGDTSAEVRLLADDGRALISGLGLRAQGITDGALLHLSADPCPASLRVHDDIVELVAESVTTQLQPWRSAIGRRTTLAAGAVLLLLGAAGLAGTDEAHTPIAGALAGVVASVLVSGAVVLSRSRREHVAGGVIAWLGSGYAAVAGLIAAGQQPFLGPGFALAGVGGLVAALAGAGGLAQGRELMVSPVVLAALAVAGGLLLPGIRHPTEVLTATLVLVVIAGSLLAWLSLSLSGIRPPAPMTERDAVDAQPCDSDRISRDVGFCNRLLLSMQATVGLVLALLVPVAVSLGIAGTALSIVCCAVVALRARQHVVGAQVLVGLLSGLVGLIVVGIAATVQHPQWTPVLAVALVVGGLGGLSILLLPTGPSLRRGWLGDVLESLALISLLPLLAVATGLVDAVQR